jgi:heme A synthase
MNARKYSYWVFGVAALSPLFGALLTGFEGKPDAPTVGLLHIAFAGLLAAGVAVQAVVLRREQRNAQILNAAALVLLALEGLSGGGGTAALPDSSAVIHALLAPLIAGVCAVVPDLLATEADWVHLEHGRALRLISLWLPPLTLMQIIFGALYRHKIWGILPHMAGALVVALLSLIVCTLLMQRAPEGTTVRGAAVMLLSAVLTQVTLGIAAFVMRLLEIDTTVAFTIVAALHVATGSAVFFTGCVLAFRAQKIAFGESQ